MIVVVNPVSSNTRVWLAAGLTDIRRGGNSMAFAFTPIETAKLNKVDP